MLFYLFICVNFSGVSYPSNPISERTNQQTRLEFFEMCLSVGIGSMEGERHRKICFCLSNTFKTNRTISVVHMRFRDEVLKAGVYCSLDRALLRMFQAINNNGH